MNNTPWGIVNSTHLRNYAVLRACKQISDEASCFAWKGTDFDFSMPSHLAAEPPKDAVFSTLKLEHLRYVTVHLTKLFGHKVSAADRKIFGPTWGLRLRRLTAVYDLEDNTDAHDVFGIWMDVWPALDAVEQFVLQLERKQLFSDNDWKQEKRENESFWKGYDLQGSLIYSKELIAVVN